MIWSLLDAIIWWDQSLRKQGKEGKQRVGQGSIVEVGVAPQCPSDDSDKTGLSRQIGTCRTSSRLLRLTWVLMDLCVAVESD